MSANFSEVFTSLENLKNFEMEERNEIRSSSVVLLGDEVLDSVRIRICLDSGSYDSVFIFGVSFRNEPKSWEVTIKLNGSRVFKECKTLDEVVETLNSCDLLKHVN